MQNLTKISLKIHAPFKKILLTAFEAKFMKFVAASYHFFGGVN